jgi:hypothetical protein
VYRKWEAKSHLDGLSFHEKTITGGLAVEISAISRKYKVNPSWQFLRVGRAMSTLDANLNTLLGTSSPRKVLRQYFREYRKRTFRRWRKGGGLSNIAGAVGDVRLTADFATQSLRQGAMRVQGVQRKIDAVVQAVMSVIRLVTWIAIIVVAYDQAYKNDVLPDWARFASLDNLAESIDPYPLEWSILFIFFGLFLTRQAGKVKKRYKEPSITLPDRRQME